MTYSQRVTAPQQPFSCLSQSNQQEPSFINNIPKEIWAHILMNLPREDLFSAHFVSRSWHQSITVFKIEQLVTLQNIIHFQAKFNQKLENQTEGVMLQWLKEKHTSVSGKDQYELQKKRLNHYHHLIKKEIEYLISHGHVAELVKQIKEQWLYSDTPYYPLFYCNNWHHKIKDFTNAEVISINLFRQIGIKNGLFKETLDIYVLEPAKCIIQTGATLDLDLYDCFFKNFFYALLQWEGDLYDYYLKNLIYNNPNIEAHFIELIHLVESHLFSSMIDDPKISSICQNFDFNKEDLTNENLQTLSLEIGKLKIKIELFYALFRGCFSTLAAQILQPVKDEGEILPQECFNFVKAIIKQQKIYIKKTQTTIEQIFNQTKELKKLKTSLLINEIDNKNEYDRIQNICPYFIDSTETIVNELDECEKKVLNRSLLDQY